MRDIAVFIIVFGALPFILASPRIGVYFWAWLSFMNPHRLTWGAAYSFPFAQIVAITVLVSILLNTKDLRKPVVNALSVTWVVFIIWMCISTLYAVYPDSALEQLIKVLKIQLVVFLVMLLIRGRKEIEILVAVTFGSIAFYGFKGGLYTIRTAGGGIVWGPQGSFIFDNNHLAVALLMSIPLGVYLARYTPHTVVRRGIYVVIGLTALAILASYSRGALLAIMAVLAYTWWGSKRKFAIFAPLLLVIPLAFFIMPDSWTGRMGTIQNYEEDSSAMGRLNAWGYSINVANDRLTGAGFNSWSSATFRIWGPDPTDVHAAHSIYFGVLADHGWIGLLIFLLILFLGWRTAKRIIKITEGRPEQKWASDLTKMIVISMVAYVSGGAFLSLAYFDLPWQLMLMLILIEDCVKREMEQHGVDMQNELVAKTNARLPVGESGTAG